ncbi:MAG: hypothetical protein HQK83_13065 [Fibrobacteria bacterium]|nr:hypothetical protein [Fibrobacteria bacterium]
MFTTTNTKLWKQDDKLIRFDLTRVDSFTADETKACADELLRLCGDDSWPVLVDIKNAKGIQKLDLDGIIPEDETEKAVHSAAFVFPGRLSKLAAQAWLKLNKPSVPVKLFIDLSEAKKWLLSLTK